MPSVKEFVRKVCKKKIKNIECNKEFVKQARDDLLKWLRKKNYINIEGKCDSNDEDKKQVELSSESETESCLVYDSSSTINEIEVLLPPKPISYRLDYGKICAEKLPLPDPLSAREVEDSNEIGGNMDKQMEKPWMEHLDPPKNQQKTTVELFEQNVVIVPSSDDKKPKEAYEVIEHITISTQPRKHDEDEQNEQIGSEENFPEETQTAQQFKKDINNGLNRLQLKKGFAMERKFSDRSVKTLKVDTVPPPQVVPFIKSPPGSKMYIA